MAEVSGAQIVAEVERRVGGRFAPADRAAWTGVLDELIAEVSRAQEPSTRPLTQAQKDRLDRLANEIGPVVAMEAFPCEIPPGSRWVYARNSRDEIVWLELVEPEPTHLMAWDTGAARD